MSSNYVEIFNKRNLPTEVIERVESELVESPLPRVGQLRRDRVVIKVEHGVGSLPPAVSNAVSRIVDSGPGQPIIVDLRQTSTSPDPNIAQAEKVIYALNAISDFRRPSEAGVLDSDKLVAEALKKMGYTKIKINHMFEEVPDKTINNLQVETVTGDSLEQALQRVDINEGLIREFSDSSEVFIRSVEVEGDHITSSGTIHFKLS